MKTSAEFQALPAKVAQWALRQVTLAWKGYFAACATQAAHASWGIPSCRNTSVPRQARTPPADLHRAGEQAISRAPKNRGSVAPSGLAIRVETRQAAIDQVRIVPHASHRTPRTIPWMSSMSAP
jgi:hypothetical protein